MGQVGLSLNLVKFYKVGMAWATVQYFTTVGQCWIYIFLRFSTFSASTAAVIEYGKVGHESSWSNVPIDTSCRAKKTLNECYKHSWVMSPVVFFMGFRHWLSILRWIEYILAIVANTTLTAQSTAILKYVSTIAVQLFCQKNTLWQDGRCKGMILG